MPIKSDPAGGGTESDGSRSIEYCSYCYVDGAFVNLEINTAKKMQDFCIKMMKKQGMAGWKAWLFTRGIPRLRRWKSA